MGFWTWLWMAAFVFGIASFVGISVVVGWNGFFEIRDLLDRGPGAETDDQDAD